MGNDIGTPSLNLVKNSELLPEYTVSKLLDIREAAEFYASSAQADKKMTVQRAEFDEIFGHIFKDSDMHFNLFRKKGEAHVDPNQVLCVLGLLSTDSPSSKLSFFHALYFEDKEETIEACLLNWFRNVLAGLNSTFSLQPTNRDVAQDAVGYCLRNFKATHKTHDGEGGEDKTTGSSLQVLDILQLIQENHTVCKFTDAVLSLCTPAQSILASSNYAVMTSNMLAESKLMNEANRTGPRTRPPLWRFSIMDFYDESWLLTLPQANINNTVFSIMELIFCSGKSAIPVYRLGSAPPMSTARGAMIATSTTATAAEGVDETRQAVLTREQINSLKDMDREKALQAMVESDRLEKMGHPPETFQLFAVVDEFTMMMWLAESCPKSILQPAEMSRSPSISTPGEGFFDSRKSTIATLVSPDDRTAGQLDVCADDGCVMSRSDRLTANEIAIGNRSRRASFAGSVQNQWQEMALRFAGCTMLDMFRAYVTPKKDAGKLVGVEQHADKSTPTPPISRRCEVLYTRHDLYQTDQFIYNVLELIAKGYRNVPVASSRFEPYRVSHLISSVDVASFLRMYYHEILGRLAQTTVEECGLMKKPVLIDMTANFGSAIHVLSQRGVEMAAIVDDRGRWCGRLEARCVTDFWWAWREHIQKPGVRNMTKEEMKVAYTRGFVDTVNVDEISNFSIFSMLLSPLRACDLIGVSVKDFEEYMSDKPPVVPTVTLHEDSEDDSSSDSDDSSSSGSSSSAASVGSKSDESHSVKSSTSKHSARPSLARMDKQRSQGTERSDTRNSTASAKSGGALSSVEETAIRLRAERDKRREKFNKWILEMGLIQASDTIATALEVMHMFKTSKAFVVNTIGEVIGVLSVKDIAKELIKIEKRQQGVAAASAAGSG